MASLDIEAIAIALEAAGGNISAAARALGVPRTTLRCAIGRSPTDYTIGASGHTLKGVSVLSDPDGTERQRWTKTTRAGRADVETTHIPDPRKIDRVSTLYDQDGRVTQQWVSEKQDAAERESLWREFAAGLAEELPRVAPIPAPDAGDANLLAVYPIGDHHFGMLAWPPETGEAYDLEIASRLLDRATEELVGMLPPCGQCLVAVLGDFLHYDSFEPVTPTSKHRLDADSRYPKMIRCAMRAVRKVIERAAERHDSVRVIIEIGNHDMSSAVFLAEALSHIYESNPRIEIDTSPAVVHYFEFGRVLIGTHHGHTIKARDLPMIMATDCPEAWGRTQHRYWLTGHVHHSAVSKDHGQVSVESFRVLASTDAWARGAGYRSIRDMRGIVMHRNLGEVARYTVKPEMFEGVAA